MTMLDTEHCSHDGCRVVTWCLANICRNRGVVSDNISTLSRNTSAQIFKSLVIRNTRDLFLFFSSKQSYHDKDNIAGTRSFWTEAHIKAVLIKISKLNLFKSKITLHDRLIQFAFTQYFKISLQFSQKIITQRKGIYYVYMTWNTKLRLRCAEGTSLETVFGFTKPYVDQLFYKMSELTENKSFTPLLILSVDDTVVSGVHQMWRIS